jgi:hypothetical protein
LRKCSNKLRDQDGVWEGLTTSILEHPLLLGDFKQRWVNHFAGRNIEPANYKYLQPEDSPFENCCVFYSYVTKNRLILNAAKYGCGRRAVEETVNDIQIYVQEWMKRRDSRQSRDRVLRKFRCDAYMDHYFVRTLNTKDRKRNAIVDQVETNIIDSTSLDFDEFMLKAAVKNNLLKIELWYCLLECVFLSFQVRNFQTIRKCNFFLTICIYLTPIFIFIYGLVYAK